MTQNKLILVTGASGYIASKLVPRLLETGYAVRCMVRTEGKLAHAPWRSQVEVVYADVAEKETLAHALAGVHTAYYLIHNMSSGHGYHQIEMQGAHNFAQEAGTAGVRHIIYLGGLADPKADIAPHMRSRFETGNALRENEVPVTEFRAGVIVGPGSISFEMIRYLSEQFPVLVGPPWLKNKSQPISAKNVIDYLYAALENPNGRGEIFEIGGPDVMTYAETMSGYCRARQHTRPIVTVPYIPTALMAYVVDKLTPVESAIAYPLIEGLHSDSVISDPNALTVFPEIELQSFKESVEQALLKLHPGHVSHAWRSKRQNSVCVKCEGFLIASTELQLNEAPQDIYPRLLAWAEAHPESFQIETAEQDQLVVVKTASDNLGEKWIIWEIIPGEPAARLHQTGYFAPRGVTGFLSRPLWMAWLKKVHQQVSEAVSPH